MRLHEEKMEAVSAVVIDNFDYAASIGGKTMDTISKHDERLL